MLRFPVDDVLRQIDHHWQNLLIARSVSPYLKNFMVGQRESPTAPYYKNRGYEAVVKFSQPLDIDKIKTINFAGHWINQGFVVRLSAYLEYCRVYGNKINIKNELPGSDEIDMLRRLRNSFAHTSGYYNPDDKEQKKLYERIVVHFGLDSNNFPEQERLFPIPIDEVLGPLVEGCKKYVMAYINYDGGDRIDHI